MRVFCAAAPQIAQLISRRKIAQLLFEQKHVAQIRLLLWMKNGCAICAAAPQNTRKCAICASNLKKKYRANRANARILRRCAANRAADFKQKRANRANSHVLRRCAANRATTIWTKIWCTNTHCYFAWKLIARFAPQRRKTRANAQFARLIQKTKYRANRANSPQRRKICANRRPTRFTTVF